MRFPNFRPLARALLLLPLATTPEAARAGGPSFQTLEWGAQANFPLPANSHFGARFGLQRGGNILLVTAPDGGVRSGYVWDDEDGWRDVTWTVASAGPQFFELAPDLLGVAVTRVESDSTTAIWMHSPTASARNRSSKASPGS